MFNDIEHFIDNKLPWISFPQNMGLASIIEIIILAILIYQITGWIKDKKAYILFKGIFFILIFYILAQIFHFYVFTWIFENSINIIITILIVIFQPELRKALESIGQKRIKIIPYFLSGGIEYEKYNDKTIDEIIKAVKVMAKEKTGALILIEQNNSLIEYEQTGISINSDISNQLLINIFEHNTPLHDGALIIKENKITAATCYLPLSDNKDVSKSLGTRHRAALGASEVTDAIIIVVSEETGKISVARKGNLEHDLSEERLKEILIEGQQKETKEIKENKGGFNLKWKK